MKPETSFEIAGARTEDFINFIEDLPPNSPYKTAKLVELKKNVGDGRKASLTIGAVLLLLVSVGKDLVKDLLKDFFKKMIEGGNYTAKYKIVNDKGRELEITLNNLSREDLDQLIDEFQGNIIKVDSGTAE